MFLFSQICNTLNKEKYLFHLFKLYSLGSRFHWKQDPFAIYSQFYHLIYLNARLTKMSFNWNLGKQAEHWDLLLNINYLQQCGVQKKKKLTKLTTYCCCRLIVFPLSIWLTVIGIFSGCYFERYPRTVQQPKQSQNYKTMTLEMLKASQSDLIYFQETWNSF